MLSDDLGIWFLVRYLFCQPSVHLVSCVRKLNLFRKIRFTNQISISRWKFSDTWLRQVLGAHSVPDTLAGTGQQERSQLPFSRTSKAVDNNVITGRSDSWEGDKPGQCDNVRMAPLVLGLRVPGLVLWVGGRSLEKKHSWTGDWCKQRPRPAWWVWGSEKGACGWTQLGRGNGEMKLGGGQGLGTLGTSFDDKSSGKP